MDSEEHEYHECDTTEDSTKNVSLSDSILFSEHDEAYKCIAEITSAFSSGKQQALERLRRIYDQYLESPTLLDQYVGPMVTSLMECARRELSHDKDTIFSQSNVDDCCTPYALSAIYALSKVRGRKTVEKFLSHSVQDVEPILRALKQVADFHDNIGNSATNSKNSCENSAQLSLDNKSVLQGGPQPWESLYMLWNWMGTLSLVPFHCTVVLPDAEMLSLIDLGKRHLSHTGPTREAAVTSLAAWLARPDLETTQLPAFVEWCHGVIVAASLGTSRDQFVLLGVIQTLVTILKVSSSARENLLAVMTPLWEAFVQLAESNVCDNNLLLRKLLVKWWARMGCTFLPPQVATWRYQRGRRSLIDNLHQPATAETSEADLTTPPENCQPRDNDKDGNRLLEDVPDPVEDAMGFVVEALRDSSTIVRWSAAKGIGRLTERLPSICAHDALDAVLELFLNPENDQGWHGACLALAELARRGLLLPSRLPEVVPEIVRAIQLDIRRGQTSVGAHVRDAACYTYWAFARAYEPSVLKPFISELSESIIVTCLFDREVNCRRAASAAFQECVGRQGADNFKHGISILTTADYFALGNRTDAFTSIALHVATFPEYQRPIIDHVYKVKLGHWDISIRELASSSLYHLSLLDPKYMGDSVIPALLESCLDPKHVALRHGSILGLAQTVLALGEKEDRLGMLSQDMTDRIAEAVHSIEKKRLYRGRGGEMVRSAVCRLIRCTSLARIPLSVPQQVRLLDSIDACLPHPNESIQSDACQALGALMSNYFPVGPNGPSERLQKRVVDKYVNIIQTSENPAATRGFTLALGYLPKKLFAPTSAALDSVIRSLAKTSRHDARVGKEKDAETRRNAIIALKYVCQTVGIDAPNGPTGLNREQALLAFEAFFLGLEDYNVDRRGDVGSWCRIEAMKGLEALTCLVIENGAARNDYFSPSLCHRLIGGLFKQFAEKLDAARVEAGACLSRLLQRQSPLVPHIPKHESLMMCLGLVDDKGVPKECTSNFADAATTYPMVELAADIEELFSKIIAGLVISVGGLTESVSKCSTVALLGWAKRAKGSDRIVALGTVLINLLKSHSRNGRVILPLLKTINILLSHQCLDELIHNESEDGFSSSLLLRLRIEEKNCADIHRLFACVDAALGLLMASSHAKRQQDQALAFACSMLCHRFPRVRRYTAEHMYVSLLETPELIVGGDQSDTLLEMLLNGPWDSELNPLQVREMTQGVCTALGVSLPSIALPAHPSQARTSIPHDEFGSYAALVGSVAK